MPLVRDSSEAILLLSYGTATRIGLGPSVSKSDRSSLKIVLLSSDILGHQGVLDAYLSNTMLTSPSIDSRHTLFD